MSRSASRGGAHLDRRSALEALAAQCERPLLDRARIALILDALRAQDADDETNAAVLRFADALLAGGFGDRRHPDLVERCVRLLGRTPYRQALPFLRAASQLYLPTDRGDPACQLRALALIALHDLEPHEARFVAARLVADADRTNSGEPAHSAIAVLGAHNDDVALVVACRTVLAGELPLLIAALQQLSPDTPPDAFWGVAEPFVGDRFPDAVLAVTDIAVEGRRSDLLPGFARALPQVSDPDLMRAVLLSLVSAHLDGVDGVFAAVVDRAPRRALPGVEDALEVARIATRDKLVTRLQDRLRRNDEAVR